MLLMMGEVLSFKNVSAALPDNGFWKFLCFHQSHVEWVGCSLHDLIQPSFSFIVGVALPFSIAGRLARGQTQWRLSLHAFWRALLLLLLGVFLRSTGSSQTNWTFEDTLTQIGLGYGFLFLLGFRPVRDQWLAFAGLLVGYWALFAAWPLPGAGFDWKSAGVTPDWSGNLNGFAAHWNKNTNPAWAFDTWFLNLFSRAKPFTNNGGGYATISFIPTLATMILGLLAGGVLRSERTALAKVRWLTIAGVVCLAGGALLGWLGICPVVKRIWTPAWALFSGGWCFLFLAAFYWLAEIRNWRAWTFPLVVIGANSITIYCLVHLISGFIQDTFKTHLGADFFKVLGAAYQPLLGGAATLVVFWLMLYWMYRRKLFLKL